MGGDQNKNQGHSFFCFLREKNGLSKPRRICDVFWLDPLDPRDWQATLAADKGLSAVAAVNASDFTQCWVWSLARQLQSHCCQQSCRLLQLALHVTGLQDSYLFLKHSNCLPWFFWNILLKTYIENTMELPMPVWLPGSMGLAIPQRVRFSSACHLRICVRPVRERKWLKQRQGDLSFIPGLILVPDASSLHKFLFLAQIFPMNWMREELGQC